VRAPAFAIPAVTENRMTSRSLSPHSIGSGPTSAFDPLLERIYGKIEALETIVAELSTHRLVSMEEKLDGLRDLLARRRKDHFTVEEVAELTGRSAYTIRRWISLGKLKAHRISEGGPRGRLLIAATELERLVPAGRGAKIPESALGGDPV
jgi:excisionase family DNA binding protein